MISSWETQMKLLITTALAASLLAGTAYAADLVMYEEPVPMVEAPAFDWTGFYVGINGGLAGGTFEHPVAFDDGEDDVSGTVDITSSGFLYGVQAGANWQLDDNFLIGIEADVQGSSVDGRLSIELEGDGPGETLAADAGTSLDWLATIRPRLGFVHDQFLVYATGGLAFGQTTSSASLAFGEGLPLELESENDRFGYTVGAGIEYALAENITFKTEYLYTDLGTETLYDDDDFTLESSVAFHTVRAGLNFQF